MATELPAGRDLDRLIREKVLDLHFSDGFHYSTDWMAAGHLVAQLRAAGWNFACDDMGGSPWWAEFSQAGYRRGGQASADTLPLAVCRAALAAVDTA